MDQWLSDAPNEEEKEDRGVFCKKIQTCFMEKTCYSLDLCYSKLTSLPDIFNNPSFNNLNSLNLRGCTSLTSLPESFGSNLPATDRLDLRFNRGLQGIPMQMLDLPHNCTIDLTGCALSIGILERLREVTSSPDYIGPRISYAIADRTGRAEEKSIQESLKGLYQIIGKAPTEFANLANGRIAFLA